MSLHTRTITLAAFSMLLITFATHLSANPALLEAQSTACQKADSIWNDKILPSRYIKLPPLTEIGFFDLSKLADTRFSIKALTSSSDELEEGRRKLVHAFGAEARLKLVIFPEAKDRYSGIFQSGSECIIARFSVANKPTAKTSVPALALKFFIDKEHPSVNLHLMHSVDGQDGHNFFAQPFSNILPPANSFATRLLDRFFSEVAVEFGAKDPNPGRLTLEHLANTQTNGESVSFPITPHQLIIKPAEAAQILMQFSTIEDDFRARLNSLPVGEVIYDVYTRSENEPTENLKPLGQLLLTSPVVSSRYGDEKLYFQHNMEKK